MLTSYSLPSHASGFLLVKRLRNAIEKSGGVARVAVRSGISRAQLSRYLQGNPIPSDRLLALAESLDVGVGWLLGEENATHERFKVSFERTRDYSARILRLLQRMDMPRAFQPPETARVLELMLLSQHYVVEQCGKEIPFSDYDLEYGFTYIEGMRHNDWLDVYVDGCAYLAEYGTTSLNATWANKWATIVREAFKNHYGQKVLVADYFERLNYDIPPHTGHYAMMEMWTEFLLSRMQGRAKVHIVDAGCGNGRHLAFLHKRGDRFVLHGIDTSPHALDLCRLHQTTNRLPKGAVQQGDMFAPPFADGSVDAYMSITNLQFLPLIPGSLNAGVGLALQEAWRILRPGGYALLLVQAPETPNEFFPMFQFHHEENVFCNLLAQIGFKVVHKNPLTLQSTGQPGARFGRGVLFQTIWILHKPD